MGYHLFIYLYIYIDIEMYSIYIYRGHDEKPGIDGYPSIEANLKNSWPWRVWMNCWISCGRARLKTWVIHLVMGILFCSRDMSFHAYIYIYILYIYIYTYTVYYILYKSLLMDWWQFWVYNPTFDSTLARTQRSIMTQPRDSGGGVSASETMVTHNMVYISLGGKLACGMGSFQVWHIPNSLIPNGTWKRGL